MKAIIISDLHANLAAIRALPEAGDELWVAGDIVNYGPEPHSAVEFVMRSATLAVRGNHDHAVGYGEDPRCTPRYAEMAAVTQAFSEGELTEQEKKFLRELPLQLDFERDSRRIRMCHAVPSNPLYGYCPADSSHWEKELQSIDADFLIVGHTHTPFVRTIGKKKVLNPGSLGQPKTGKSDACYAVWQDGDVELKQFPYGVGITVSQIESMPWPAAIRQDLVTVLRTGSVS